MKRKIMINISKAVSHELINWHLQSVRKNFCKVFLEDGATLRDESKVGKLSFERKFYRDMCVSKETCRELIGCSTSDLENFFDSSLFKRYQIYFIFCLPEELRKPYYTKPYFQHFFRYIPREFYHSYEPQSLDSIAQKVQSRAKIFFDYDRFSKVVDKKFKDGKWNGYSFSKKLGIKVCPSCNFSDSDTVYSSEIEKKGQIRVISRAPLDHFYCKSKYPFLALSAFNLIPSCERCNNSLKRGVDYMVKKHLRPYIEGLEDFATFICEPKIIDKDFVKDIFNSNRIDVENYRFDVVCKKNKSKGVENLASERSANSLTTIKIIERYNNNMKTHKAFFKKLFKISDDYLEQQLKLDPGMTKKELIEDLLEIDFSGDNETYSYFALLKKNVAQKILSMK